jgi:hypothetical protein
VLHTCLNVKCLKADVGKFILFTRRIIVSEKLFDLVVSDGHVLLEGAPQSACVARAREYYNHNGNQVVEFKPVG